MLAILTVVFSVTLIYMDKNVVDNRKKIEELYQDSKVVASIVKRKPGEDDSQQGFVRKKTVDALRETDFVSEFYLESAGERAFLMLPSQQERSEWTYDLSTFRNCSGFYGIDDPDRMMRKFSAAGEARFTYGEGWSEKIFSEVSPNQEVTGNTVFDITGYIDPELLSGKTVWEKAKLLKTVPAVLSDTMTERFHLTMGDRFYIFERRGGGVLVECVVAGTHTGISMKEMTEPIIISRAALEKINELANYDTLYSAVDCVVDSRKNREIEQFQKIAEAVLGRQDSGTVDLSLIIRDEELRFVVRPLEKKLELLRALIPVTIGISLVAVFGICMIYGLQNKKEAAIMRSLGRTKIYTIGFFSTEQIFACTAGLLVGFVVNRIGAGNMSWGAGGKFYMFSFLYFITVCLSSILSGLLIIRQGKDVLYE